MHQKSINEKINLNMTQIVPEIQDQGYLGNYNEIIDFLHQMHLNAQYIYNKPTHIIYVYIVTNI